MGMAIVTRITMMVLTTISSTNVKPRRLRPLPLRIGAAIGSLLGCLAIHIEYILTSPTGALGVVCVAAHAPLRGPREGVARNAAEEADFFAVRAIELLAFDQNVQ